MRFDSSSSLAFEISRLLEVIENHDRRLIEKCKKEYNDELVVSRKEILYRNRFYVFSPDVSYHVLCIYLLLDIIDSAWNGHSFTYFRLKPDYFLLQELNVFPDFVPFSSDLRSTLKSIERAEYLFPEQLYIFLLPHEHKKGIPHSDLSYPNNILILYSERGKSLETQILTSLSLSYLRLQYNDRLPKWARNEVEFIEDFISYCQGEPSRIKPIVGPQD